MCAQHTRETLLHDLRVLGVEQSDILFMHSSFKSLGPVEGGVATVIGALEDAVGHEGLLLIPSFNLVAAPQGIPSGPKRAEIWDIETTLSAVGWITEYFRRMPGTYRSDHFSNSVAARGKGAKEFVSGHLGQEGLKAPWDREPWGKTYGTNSPMYRAYKADGKLLMLGVDYESSTYCHMVEAMHWNMLLDQEAVAMAGDKGSTAQQVRIWRSLSPSELRLDVEWRGLKRPALGEFWDRSSKLSRGCMGDADCRMFRIREYVDTLLREVIDNPDPYWV